MAINGTYKTMKSFVLRWFVLQSFLMHLVEKSISEIEFKGVKDILMHWRITQKYVPIYQ